MNTSPRTTQSLIELAKSIASSVLRINPVSWDAEAAFRCAADLERLLDYTANLDVDALRSPGLALYADLSALNEGASRPEAAQCSDLHRLARELLAALAEFAPATAVSSGKSVYALATSTIEPARLAAELQQEGLELRWFTDAEELLGQMQARPPQAVLAELAQLQTVAELIDGLAEKSPERALIPLIAVGSGDDAQRLQALIGGATLYVSSFQDTALARQVRELIVEHAGSAYRVLLVDDDRSITEFCSIILRRAGIECKAVQEADQVLPAVRSFQPDLVLMDLYMPGQDGMSLTAELRLQADALVLPIVFLSGEQSSKARFLAIQAGGDDFLTKPIRPRHLLAAVRSRIKRVRTLSRQLNARPDERGELVRRGHFLSSLREQLEEETQDCCALLSLSVDQCAALETRLGLAAEYELEQALAQHLLACCNPTDRICLWQELGFGVLARRADSKAISALAESMRQAISRQPFKVRGESMPLNISIGIANRPSKAGGIDPWIASAFAAMNAAQRLGGNRIEGLLEIDEVDMPPERALWLRELLAHAAHGVGLVPEFQPVIPLRGQDQGLYALEMSLRDRRQPLVGIPRADYLKLARKHGVLPQLERIALSQALEALDEQRSRGRLANVSVPVDLASFDRALLTWLEAEIKGRGFNGQSLSIEFDGRTLLERPNLIGIVKRLRMDGLRIITADHSGDMDRLLALHALPVHGLRVSATCLLEADHNAVSRLIDRWHADGRVIIVDRVDEVAWLSKMWTLGVDYLQGSKLAAPSPRLDFDFCEISL